MESPDRAAALAVMARLGERLFGSALVGLTDAQASERVGEANSAAFVTCHLVDARYYLLKALGEQVESPLAGLLGGVSHIDEAPPLPPLDELRAMWADASDRLRRRLAEVTPDELDAPPPTNFPIDDPSLGGMATFLLMHEMYHIGQLGLIRRQLGAEAMAWR